MSENEIKFHVIRLTREDVALLCETVNESQRLSEDQKKTLINKILTQASK